ncbi:MAG: 16S rRNA (uracil1498-N3)-methyltransferase [Paracoccaceae bacterium]|jgi:16S rRNA (uracil1498-N3)-methyltransferase
MSEAKIRLYVEHPLSQGQAFPLSTDQAHYLFVVMRQVQGGDILVFNGKDGEWCAKITQIGKRGGILLPQEKTRPLKLPPDLWLLFAPIKKVRTNFIVEKAAEMGAMRILPVQTKYTNADRLRQDRLQAHAIEAAEQCGSTFVPHVDDMIPLARLLKNWPKDRGIFWCDETLVTHPPLASAIPACGPWAILIGPEGGFSLAEQKELAAMPQAVPMRLGPRILRADTAAVAALALWQVEFGDWSVK